MLSAFDKLKSALKISRLCTESVVFFLHYRVTATALLFCCIVISADRFSGDKIKCLSKPSGEIDTGVLNNYCWSTSTYSVATSYLKEVGVHVPHPGIEGSEDQSHYEYRNFYQYVHLVLFIQALLFYLPHMLWKNYQPSFLNAITQGIKDTLFETKDTLFEKKGTPSETKDTPSEADTLFEKKDAPSETKKKAKKPTLGKISTFLEDKWNTHNFLAIKYFMCELLAFFNLLFQAYILDVFLHGKFLILGLYVKKYYNSEILSDPTRLFPVVTICSFKRYGPTGYIDVIDALCVLPINAINAKIYLCLWIWFVILLPLSFANLIYLTISCLSLQFRVALVKVSHYLKRSPGDESYIKLVSQGGFGDWFILSSIKNDVEERSFCYLTESIESKLPLLEVEDDEC